MTNRLTWLLVLCALLLIGDFYVLMTYGYALRSTNLFIARSTIFYPLAWLNLVAGILSLFLVVLVSVRRPRK